MIDHTEINQTQFSSSEPLMEGLANYDEPVVDQAGLDVPKKKNTKLILVGVIGFILIVVFILLLVLIKALTPTKTITSDQDGNQIIQQNGEIDPLLEEVYALSEDLSVADPSLNTIPFPPVDMELRLDQAVRK